ncbi:esterase-like activity of phytase family protein [Taylorella equigenitalis]|uniref:esterase-like activity of phytase family protein n=1 Tax=Taylorella equigenitalis TaxID=29575 RepID=UPI0023B19F2A|nr:esterase-like activity of phytase family protein [Taylorella equigenitalis]WEE00284.1 esterase-like activity of phytase family protein [Taylorella equigenitalis]WEE01761.1 esterase-like activity of phytase family protein [Taylorella equigenitalis]WFD78298.1 esterase-like activity of phytase family protein [Taylorella equigenitalis]WFD79776.1 esterase-like activity of phytase family protein [Taylorella equigenitalis]WFD81252.1 esterase-like activity of phytase family protein [Taylorella equi
MKFHKFTFSITALLLSASLNLSYAGDADINSLKLIGSYEIETGTQAFNTEFGGISGLDMAEDGLFWAISDERGGEKGTPRFYKIKLEYDENGIQNFAVDSVHNMQTPQGENFSSDSRTVDPEAIRHTSNGTLYWSSEGNWNDDSTKRYQPFIREIKEDGSYFREFKIPEQFLYKDNKTSGVRNNNSFEGLAVTPNGSMFFATEVALYQDGEAASVDNGSKIRITKFDPSANTTLAQYVYELPKIPTPSPKQGYVDNGLTELLAISDNEFLTLERSFADGVGNTIRIVKITITDETTDVKDMDSLKEAKYTPVERKVVLELTPEFEGIKMDNMEAMSWGKTLTNGHKTLVIASDNNFNKKQRTLFMVFEVN